MLVLKRWDMDQTRRLFDDETHRGEYVSFQGYHFIDILAADENKSLFDIYQRTRLTKMAQNESDVHTVQSIAMISDTTNEAFWKTDTQRLNITFLQLTDSTEWSYEQIKEKMQALFEADDQWALYYSLDFCDLVLLTKNVEVTHFNDITWKLSLLREGQAKVIYDTFSIVSFHADYLKKCFEEIDAPKSLSVAEANQEKAKKKLDELVASLNENPEDQLLQKRESVLRKQYHLTTAELEQARTRMESISPAPVWDDTLSLLVNLSIKNVAALFDLLNKLSENGITYDEHRLPGRYDVNILLNRISGQQAILVLYLIDQQTSGATSNNGCQPIGNYEVVFMAEKWGGKKRICFIPESKQNFEKIIVSRINDALEYSSTFSGDLKTYIFETLRATRELSNTGFSEEFILSTYPSIITFLRLLEEVDIFCQYDPGATLIESRNFMAKSFFTALNTLSLCTMHSERQFIHAPAFNASYFEIPPKLLAFYNAYVNNVSKIISGDPCYCYMITPDYRTDIHVQPLNISYKEDTEKHLAIIHLPERFFYDPESAMMLLSHEVGHYEGDRKREVRAQKVFQLISMVMLVDTGLFPFETTNTYVVDDTSLLGVLSKQLGHFLLTQFHLNLGLPNRGIVDHRSDIIDFLHNHDFGYLFFQQNDTRRQIIHSWKEGMKAVDFSNPEQADVLQHILEAFDEQEETLYYTKLTNCDMTNVAFEPISQFIANKIFFDSAVASQGQREMLISQYELVIQAFSEAFADVQMVRILGKAFNVQQYVSLLKETDQSFNCGDNRTTEQFTAEQIVRCNVLCKMYDFDLPDSSLVSEHLLTNTIIQKVIEYLNECGDMLLSASFKGLDVNAFINANPFAQCRMVSDVLHDYKDMLTQTYI